MSLKSGELLEPMRCNLLHALELERLDLMALASIHDLLPQTLNLELHCGDLIREILRDVFVVGCHEERDGIVRCGSFHVSHSTFRVGRCQARGGEKSGLGLRP